MLPKYNGKDLGAALQNYLRGTKTAPPKSDSHPRYTPTALTQSNCVNNAHYTDSYGSSHVVSTTGSISSAEFESVHSKRQTDIMERLKALEEVVHNMNSTQQEMIQKLDNARSIVGSMQADINAKSLEALEQNIKELHATVSAISLQLQQSTWEIKESKQNCCFDGSLTRMTVMSEPPSPVIELEVVRKLSPMNIEKPPCSSVSDASLIDEYMSFEQYLRHKAKQQASNTATSHLSTLLLKESFDEFIFQDTK